MAKIDLGFLTMVLEAHNSSKHARSFRKGAVIRNQLRIWDPKFRGV